MFQLNLFPVGNIVTYSNILRRVCVPYCIIHEYIEHYSTDESPDLTAARGGPLTVLGGDWGNMEPDYCWPLPSPVLGTVWTILTIRTQI